MNSAFEGGGGFGFRGESSREGRKNEDKFVSASTIPGGKEREKSPKE